MIKDVTWAILTGSGSIPAPCMSNCMYDSADASKFRLSINTARTARVEFKTAPDYETATSVDGDHDFWVALRATAGSESFTVTIKFVVKDATTRAIRDRNGNEVPVTKGNFEIARFSFPENTTGTVATAAIDYTHTAAYGGARARPWIPWEPESSG